MNSLIKKYFAPDTRVSFEFFPPKTLKLEERLWHTVEALKGLEPEFVSVTYGAGGSTRERTQEIVKKIQNETTLSAAAHLTCVGASRDEIDDIAREYWDSGIKHIVALRGDGFEAREDGYKYASELVEGLKKVADFEISVAGYPEKHPECDCVETDIENLKRKVDMGADRVITQFFMEPECFLKWRDMVRSAGITVPIIPGVLPINHFEKATKFAKMCEADIPPWMYELFEGLDEQPDVRDQVAIALAVEQCSILKQNGIDDFHFYTLNRPDLVISVCRMLGIKGQ